MNIIKQDKFVADISCSQISDVSKAFKHFNGFGDIELFETIHGHIARFKVANEACHALDNCKGAPYRMLKRDYDFLALDLFRFVDASFLFIVVGVK